MRRVYTILALFSILVGCSTTPSYVFYKSNSGVPQKAKAINTEFFMTQFSDDLPFAILAAIDRDMFSNVNSYYVIVSLGLYSKNYSYKAVDFANSLVVTMTPSNTKKLIAVIDSSLNYYKGKSPETNGNNIQFSILSDPKSVKNQAEYLPDLEFIFRSFTSGNEIYFKVNVNDYNDKPYSQIFNLKKPELNELRYRLSESIRILESLGYKE